MTDSRPIPRRVRFERRYGFSASHLYRRPEWSEDENRAAFGKCANPPGHGHNYRLWVAVEGEPDARTGFAVELLHLDRIVGARILDRVDHQHLNHALEAFRDGGEIPTAENLVLWMASRLIPAIEVELGARLVELRLFEDDDLGASWRPE